MKYYSFLIYVFLITGNQLIGQSQIEIYPDYTGEELFDHIVADYTPTTILNYSNARDTLFSKIDNHNDSLTCVYSGHTIYLDPIKDPTQAAFMNGISDGINTEHTFPQSMGAESGNARSDMHHLFPTRTGVNSARGNKAFGDIHDSVTDSWYYLNYSSNETPQSEIIDLFSESTIEKFEPREDHKGNVARAMFYFYTIYRDEADAANNSFFEEQRETLCQWHILDPVDDIEYQRTEKIAFYQEDIVNPFIYDCTLANRLYCPNISCTPTQVESVVESTFIIYPNPATSSTTIEFQSASPNITIQIIDMHGNIIIDRNIDDGHLHYHLSLEQLIPGIYNILVLNDGQYSQSKILSKR